ncbi:Hypothetical protein R9X50_00275800 [Acrodontium crateriforme]|uniref:NAD(P)-binding domain-containing protein n=1 Tax=Acrodontium crateriforme TaxID=150365 RepID=A0AAQ3M4W6_9PEZI|nr:Hypothetical protein R9X50_00275800 [Acrodontium crateriforme]
MHVVVAGSGDLARYICEEFGRAGHQLTVLTRTHKPALDLPGVHQVITDYSLSSLEPAIVDGQVLISTINNISPAYVTIHMALLQACQKSRTCKRLIPSEFAGDIAAYPDQPGFYTATREPIRQALREQTNVEWTIIALGWLADYCVPAQNRYIKDIGDDCPIHMTNHSLLIPGTGSEPVDLTWARDVAKALAVLVQSPDWEPITYMSGVRTCWNDVEEQLRARYSGQTFTSRHVSLQDITNAIQTASEDSDAKVSAEYWLFSASHAASVPPEQVRAHRQKFFPDVYFRTLQDGLHELKEDHAHIL